MLLKVWQLDHLQYLLLLKQYLTSYIFDLIALLDTQIERCSDTEGLEAVGFTLEPEEGDGIDNGAGNNNLVNGFLLGTVPDNKGIVGSLQRRYATATDSLGVVVLKGEPSFSANDQILIDELAFYITSNDLKAN